MQGVHDNDERNPPGSLDDPKEQERHPIRLSVSWSLHPHIPATPEEESVCDRHWVPPNIDRENQYVDETLMMKGMDNWKSTFKDKGVEIHDTNMWLPEGKDKLLTHAEYHSGSALLRSWQGQKTVYVTIGEVYGAGPRVRKLFVDLTNWGAHQ